MPSAEARVHTDRAGRYLVQLCQHTTQISGLHHLRRRHGGDDGGMIMPRRAEHTGNDGVIDFERGRCTLRATADELILVAEADDQRDLQAMQDALAARLERIGRRDHLSLTWQAAQA